MNKLLNAFDSVFEQLFPSRLNHFENYFLNLTLKCQKMLEKKLTCKNF